MTDRLPAFECLIQELRQVWASAGDVEPRMKHAETLLKVALAAPSIVELS